MERKTSPPRTAAAAAAVAMLCLAAGGACRTAGLRDVTGGALRLDVTVGERGPILEWRGHEVARVEVVAGASAVPLSQDPAEPRRFIGRTREARFELFLREIEPGAVRLELLARFPRPATLERLSLRVLPEIGPIDEALSPALTPTPDHAVPVSGFEGAPELTVRSGTTVLSLVADREGGGRGAFLEFLPRRPLLECGFAALRPTGDGLSAFDRGAGVLFEAGDARLAATLVVSRSEGARENPRARVAEFLWRRHARPRFLAGAPLAEPAERAATLARAFLFAGRWGEVAWRRCARDGREVAGAVAEIGPALWPGAEGGRETGGAGPPLAIENTSASRGVRGALGLALEARSLERAGDLTAARERLDRARMRKDLALAGPARNGFFATVLVAGENGSFEAGEWRPGPATRPPGHERFFHVASTSATARDLVAWLSEIEDDPRARTLVAGYAAALLRVQRPDGSFPAWVHEASLAASPVELPAESAASVAFLAALARATGSEVDLDAARRGSSFLARDVLAPSRFEDAALYFGPVPESAHVTRGVRDPECLQYPRSTLAIAWVAEAFVEMARADPDGEEWTPLAERALDALALEQSTLGPEEGGVVAEAVFGSFSGGNAGRATGDPIEGLVAPIFLEGYRVTGRADHFERGVLALRAALARVLGGGEEGLVLARSATRDGFAVRYDRGAGAAADARAIVRDRFGDVYVDRERGAAFGVDGVAVTGDGPSFSARDLTGSSRLLRVAYSTGESAVVPIAAGGMAQVPESLDP